MASRRKRVATGQDIQTALEDAMATNRDGVVHEAASGGDTTVEFNAGERTKPFVPPRELMAEASGQKD